MQYHNIYILIVPIDFVMVYIRSKKVKGNIYYYLVEAIRKDNKVQQKVLMYLGTAETLFKKLKLLKNSKN